MLPTPALPGSGSEGIISALASTPFNLFRSYHKLYLEARTPVLNGYNAKSFVAVINITVYNHNKEIREIITMLGGSHHGPLRKS